MVSKQQYTLKQYNCGYCQYIFRQYVRKVGEGMDAFGKPYRNSTSSQVICPKCKAFLKTWDEGDIIEVVEHQGRLSNRHVYVEQGGK